MTSLLQNPQSDMEWSTGQLFVAMARYNTLVFQDTRNESTFEEMFEFLSSLDSQSMVRAHLSNEFDKFRPTMNQVVMRSRQSRRM